MAMTIIMQVAKLVVLLQVLLLNFYCSHHNINQNNQNFGYNF